MDAERPGKKSSQHVYQRAAVLMALTAWACVGDANEHVDKHAL